MAQPPRRPCLCGLCLPTWFSRGWTCPGTQEQLNRRSSSYYPYERVVAWPFYQLGHTRLRTWTIDDAACGLFGRTIEGHVIQAGKLKVIRVGSDHCGECGDPLPPGFGFLHLHQMLRRRRLTVWAGTRQPRSGCRLDSDLRTRRQRCLNRLRTITDQVGQAIHGGGRGSKTKAMTRNLEVQLHARVHRPRALV